MNSKLTYLSQHLPFPSHRGEEDLRVEALRRQQEQIARRDRNSRSRKTTWGHLQIIQVMDDHSYILFLKAMVTWGSTILWHPGSLAMSQNPFCTRWVIAGIYGCFFLQSYVIFSGFDTPPCKYSNPPKRLKRENPTKIVVIHFFTFFFFLCVCVCGGYFRFIMK